MHKVVVNNTVFNVDATSEKDAIDAVADYIEAMEMTNAYVTSREIITKCDVGDSIAEYAKNNGLVRCGSNGIYMEVEVQ